MGEEGGRKPSLDNPEYFLFPEEVPAAMDRNPGNPAIMDRNPVINRFHGEPATMDRFRGEPATMDRRARTVSQGGVIEDLLPPTEIMESLERIESLGERAAKGRRTRVSLSSLRRFFTTATRRGSSSGQANEYMPSPAGREAATSLPTTPSKVPSFLQYPTLGRTRKTVVKRLSGPPTEAAQEGEEALTRYYNLEANNNNMMSGGGGGVKQMSKPMKLGQPIDGRLGRAREKPPMAPTKARVSRREKVVGMEAPAPPSFHLVCRGFPSTENTIALLYSPSCPSASLAAISLQKALVSPSRKVIGVEVELLMESDERTRERLSETLYHATAQVLLVSANFLACLERTGASLLRLLLPWRTIALLCDITQAQVEEFASDLCLPLWIEVEQEKPGRWQQLVAVKVVNLLEEQQQPEEAAWRLFPRKVSQSQPKIQISLEVGLPANPPLEVTLTLDNTSYTLLEPKWLKPDLLQVELPSTLFRSTTIGTAALVIDGSHLGCRQLKLENAATMLESVWQATSDPVSLLSDAFSTSFSGLAEVDDFLKASIEERLSVADLLAGPGHHTPVGEEGLAGDHATLLHFAASHGLTRLATSLLSLGHSRFLKVPNILGLTPAECADRAGHNALARQLREHRTPQQRRSDADLAAREEHSSLHEGSDGYLLPSLLLSEDGLRVPQRHLQASSKAVEEDWYRVPPRPSPIQPYMMCGSRNEPMHVNTSPSEGEGQENELKNSDSDKLSAGTPETASPAFLVQPRLTGRPSGSYLPMAPVIASAPVRKTKSVVSPPSSLLPGPIAKSHSFSVFSPRVPAPPPNQNQSSAPKFSDLVLGDQAFQGRAISRQELLKSFTSSSDAASSALTLLQPRPESTPPVMQQHRPLLDVMSASMSASTSDMLEESPPMSAFTSNVMGESTPSSKILEHPTSTSSLLDPLSTSNLLEPTYTSNSDHHSSSSYLGSSCSSSSTSSSGMTGSPPSSATLAPTSSSPSFPVFVHTEGVRDGMVALPGEEGDEEQELVEYYEQGKISGVQLENYRRNSETREPFDEEDQSPSSSSKWRMKDVVGRFSPIRPKLGLKGSLKRRRKDEGEENRGRIREVLSMEALEDSVLNLTHTRSSNRSSCDVEEARVSLPPKIRSRQHEGSSSSSLQPPSVSASSSLYSIPRQLISEGSSLRRMPKSTSARLVNRNLGAYENVVASPRLN